MKGFVVGVALLVLVGPVSAQDKPHWVLDDPGVFIIHHEPPEDYTMMSILITGKAVDARPVTKSGRVVLIRLQDPTGIIEIPWIEGLTAAESLRAWMAPEWSFRLSEMEHTFLGTPSFSTFSISGNEVEYPPDPSQSEVAQPGRSRRRP